MSLVSSSMSGSSSDDDLLQRSGSPLDVKDAYERIGIEAENDYLEEIQDVDGNPIYHDEDDTFDYPDTEKQFGEVVVIMKHIQKGTTQNTTFLQNGRFFIFEGNCRYQKYAELNLLMIV